MSLSQEIRGDLDKVISDLNGFYEDIDKHYSEILKICKKLQEENKEKDEEITRLKSQNEDLEKKLNEHILANKTHMNTITQADRDKSLQVRKSAAEDKSKLIIRAINHYLTEKMGQSNTSNPPAVDMSWLCSRCKVSSSEVYKLLNSLKSNPNVLNQPTLQHTYHWLIQENKDKFCNVPK